ncbi:MAG: NUDIX domain-containing protein [Clostridia bacterium]|nr:NUDIX domain-containing protein [Clostridia bacterium]
MIYNRTMTATAYLYNEKTKRILLHKHKKFGELYPLGGHIEPHELPHEAVLREIYEESGASAVLADKDGKKTYSIDRFFLPSPAFLLHENLSQPIQNLDFVYIAFFPEDFDEGTPLKPLSGESREFYFVSEDEVLDGKIVRNGEEIPIPGHIKKTASLVFKSLLN